MGIRLIEIEGHDPFNPLHIFSFGKESEIITNLAVVGSWGFYLDRKFLRQPVVRRYQGLKSRAEASFDIALTGEKVITVSLSDSLPPRLTDLHFAMRKQLPWRRRAAEKLFEERCYALDAYMGSAEIAELYNSLRARAVARHRELYAQWMEALGSGDKTQFWQPIRQHRDKPGT